MAINRPSPVPDARATPKIEAAMRQIDRLITLVSVLGSPPIPTVLSS
jgi:hypothetical protein